MKRTILQLSGLAVAGLLAVGCAAPADAERLSAIEGTAQTALSRADAAAESARKAEEAAQTAVRLAEEAVEKAGNQLRRSSQK